MFRNIWQNALPKPFFLKFTDASGKPGNYLMDECWQSLYSVAFGLQKDSPYKAMISNALPALREAGLIDKWFRDELNAVGR